LSVSDLDGRARAATDAALAASNATQSEQSARLIGEAISIRRELVRRLPAEPLQAARLGWALAFQAHRYQELGLRAAALAAGSKALQIIEPLSGHGPSYELDLSYALLVLGLAQRANGQTVDACRSFERAGQVRDHTGDRTAGRSEARRRLLDERLPVVLAGCK
jgi:hypothetical protein